MPTETNSSRTDPSGPWIIILKSLADKGSGNIAWLQGFYFLIMGGWPLLSIHSFQYVTGPKTDIWLVKTVGILLMVIGVVLILAAYRRRILQEFMTLGIGSAIALAIIEIVYVFNGVISAIYLLDAGMEILLIAGWWRHGKVSE